jgi:hypothetical protein
MKLKVKEKIDQEIKLRYTKGTEEFRPEKKRNSFEVLDEFIYKRYFK